MPACFRRLPSSPTLLLAKLCVVIKSAGAVEQNCRKKPVEEKIILALALVLQVGCQFLQTAVLEEEKPFFSKLEIVCSGLKLDPTDIKKMLVVLIVLLINCDVVLIT